MKNRYLRIIFILGGLIGLAVLAYSLFLYFEPVAEVSGQKADIRLSDTQLLADFEQDPLAAEQKYKNKVLEITGTVAKVECDSTRCRIIFDKQGKFIVVNSCEEEIQKDVRSLKQNTRVTVKGIYTGYVIIDDLFMIPGEIKIDPCTIVK
jgi:hypothetical protein